MSRPQQPINHGTYGGYQVEHKRGLPVCDPCREAMLAYHRDARTRRLPHVVREEKMNRARSAALWRLKDLHREEFDLLVEDEMRVEAARAREAS